MAEVTLEVQDIYIDFKTLIQSAADPNSRIGSQVILPDKEEMNGKDSS